ncbi:hypothetical protein TWF481_003746 [Arthrobotrys musiformis]|uniref:Peptidase S8/S53 domain-containing protein n=1 Tax=Arthrobotrys musiformis TaxID=47236 RepID=A0AAV9WHF1_9PEZI
MSFFIFRFLIQCAIFSSILAASPSPDPQLSKIGVNIHWRAICILDEKFRNERDLIKDIDEGFLEGNLKLWLSSPRKYSLLKLQSDTLGVWAYGFILRVGWYKDRDEYMEDLTDDIEGYLDFKGHDWPFDTCEADFEIDPTFIYDGNLPPEDLIEDKGGTDFHRHSDRLRLRKRVRKEKDQRIPFFAASEYEADWRRSLTKSRPSVPPPSLKAPLTPRMRFRNNTSHLRSIALARRDDDNEVIARENAWEGLPTLSAPRNMEWMKDEMLSKTYFHYKNSGEGVVVYVIDADFDKRHYDLQYTKFERWTRVAGAPPLDYLTDIDGRIEHGSRMVDKIAGKLGGIAPQARVVFSSLMEGSGLMSFFSQLGALIKTYDDIIYYYADLNIPCIISMSWIIGIKRGFHETPDPIKNGDTLSKILDDILSRLTNLDNVILVTAAGNEDPSVPISSYPPGFAINKQPEKHVVVGGTDQNGLNMFQYDANLQNFVWAPADDVRSLGPLDSWPSHTILFKGGTSVATASVSGMLAMYISRSSDDDLTPKSRLTNAIAKLKQLSWKRNPKGVPIIHNGITPAEWPEKYRHIKYTYSTTTTTAATTMTRVAPPRETPP